jgi:hypothetical protein
MHKAIFIMIMTAALLYVGAAGGADYGKERPIAVLVGSEQIAATDGHIVPGRQQKGNFDIFMYDVKPPRNGYALIRSSRSIRPYLASASSGRTCELATGTFTCTMLSTAQNQR